MCVKTPVSELEEYCAKKKISKPTYEITESISTNDKTIKVFICVIKLLNDVAEGTGGTKKEAKHNAATAILKKLPCSNSNDDSNPNTQEIPQVELEIVPTYDAISELRDLCYQCSHPFPSFEIVQQHGTPEAPEFVVECRVATIKCYAKATTKKGARQLAAKKIVDIIRADSDDIVNKSVVADKNQTGLDYKKIQIYRRNVNPTNLHPLSTLLTGRHNYFKNLDNELRKKARNILDASYLSAVKKVDDLLKTLKIQYKTSEIPAKEGTLTFIELKCDLDVCFAANRKEIFQEIIDYFIDMLD